MHTLQQLGYFKAIIAMIIGLCAFNITLSAQTVTATLNITLDCWGDETGWTLKDWGGTTVAAVSAGTYNNSFPNGSDATAQTLTLNVDECYIFTYVDMGGDGILGSIWDGCDADGSFALVAESGDTLASSNNEDFSWSILRVFCVKEGCTNPDALNFNNSATINDGSCILPQPIASFSYEEVQKSCEYATVQFNNESAFALDYFWEFENGIPSSSTEKNPVVQFPVGSTSTVNLHVENLTGESTQENLVVISGSESGSSVTLELEPDCWAHELAWNLYDADFNIVASRNFGDYEGNFPSNQVTIEENFCLANGCYTFELLDEYGDGLEGDSYAACDNDGTFRFLDSNGEILVEFSGPVDFGYIYTTDFCVDLVYEWNGTIDTNWGTAENWKAGVVPPDFADVFINSLGTPLILEQDVKVNNIVVGSNSSLLFSSNAERIQLFGNLTNYGTIDCYSGLFVAKGNNTQFIKGPSIPTFHKFRMNTTGKVVFLTDVNFSGSVIMSKGELDFNNNEVSLISGFDFQGSIGTIKPASSISETITYYRYYPAGAASWRMMSTPIVDATFEQWNDDFATTGFTGSDYPNYPSAENPWSNIRTYNESYNSGAEADRHYGFESISNISDPLDNAKGYFVYFVPSPTMVDMKGEFFRGAYSPTLTYTPSDSGLVADGWNLIANPFPSTIDWDATLDSRIGLDNAIYAYDPNLKQYSAYVNGISTGLLTNRIASGQAFWVKANMDGASLTIDENDKSNAIGVHLKQNNSAAKAIVHIELSGVSGMDKCVIGFNNATSGAYDAGYDAYKFYSSDSSLPAIAALADMEDVEMAIAMFPIPENSSTIAFKMKSGNESELTITNTLVDSFDGNFCFLLNDTQLGEIVPFNEGDSYTFNVEDPEEIHHRFTITVQALTNANVVPESCPGSEDGSITVDGFGEAPWDFIWKNELGTVIKESTGLTTTDTVDELSPGFYEITVTNNQEQCHSASIVAEIPAAEDLDITATAKTANCNDQSKAGIHIDLDERYTWDLTIEDENGKFSRQLSGISSDTLLTGLELGVYAVRAMSSCGNGMVIANLDLKDPNMPTGTISTDQPNNETYPGLPIQLRYDTEDKVEVEWTLENGNRISGQFPFYTFMNEGEYKVQVAIKNAHCKTTETVNVKVNALPGTAPEEDKESENNQGGEIELVVSENTLLINLSDGLSGPVMFTVFNNNGQTILEETIVANELTFHQLDLNGLTQGIYYLNINDANGLLYSEKFFRGE